MSREDNNPSEPTFEVPKAPHIIESTSEEPDKLPTYDPKYDPWAVRPKPMTESQRGMLADGIDLRRIVEIEEINPDK